MLKKTIRTLSIEVSNNNIAILMLSVYFVVLASAFAPELFIITLKVMIARVCLLN